MSRLFEELDYRPTDMGALSLRRRRHLASGRDIFEVKLGEDFLMSSEFTDAEVALADIGIQAACKRFSQSADQMKEDPSPSCTQARQSDDGLDVVVGGLGLGYTAAAAAKYKSVRSLSIIETFADVIDWHRKGLVPLGSGLANDPRCRMIAGDFFAMAATPSCGFDPETPGRRYHAILLDVDHSPTNLLHDRHAPFYEIGGLTALAEHLHDGGVFALWSNDPPDDVFLGKMQTVFKTEKADVVTFSDAWREAPVSNIIYVATKSATK